MSFFSKRPQISVCIPVWGTETILLDCLNSVVLQQSSDFNSLEIIVVDDFSPANTAKQIVKEFSKNHKISINYIRHEYNKGLVEARRSAVYAAKGKYIFILDSDDTLPPDALKALYEAAESKKADIVQGKANVYLGKQFSEAIDSNEEAVKHFLEERRKTVNNVYLDEMCNSSENKEILDGYLIKGNHMGYLWGKLILRETYLNAFNHIPPISCTMCEDIIQYVWLCYEAKKYVGIENLVYNYSVNSGISSRSLINDLSKWERVCSTASVFTALYQEFNNPEINFTSEEKDSIRKTCIYHLKNNLRQLEVAVTPQLKEEAYNLLCDYWGQSFVEKVKNIDSKLSIG